MEIVSLMSPLPAASFVTVTAYRTLDFECHLLIQSFITGFSVGGRPIFLPILAVDCCEWKELFRWDFLITSSCIKPSRRGIICGLLFLGLLRAEIIPKLISNCLTIRGEIFLGVLMHWAC